MSGFKRRTLIDGEPAEAVAASDRALQYGDGLFETLAVVAGRPRLWESHFRRLREGARRLGIPCPEKELLQRELGHLLEGLAGNAAVKLVVTRGRGGRGYRPRADTPPTRILYLNSFPDYPRSHWTGGVEVRVCDTRLAEQPALAGIKHLNRLEQILARGEWDDDGVAEGLMRGQNGLFVEGTFTNLFALRAGRLYTADLRTSGVAGVMRGQILERCGEWDVPLRLVEGLSLDELEAAEEVFVTNSLIGLWPVRAIDGMHLRGGRGLTDRLLKWMRGSGTIPEPE